MSKYRNSDSDRFAVMFKALSNPQRLRIFLKLAHCCAPRGRCEMNSEGKRRCIGDLGADLGLAASTVSHHVKELRNSGLLQEERRGQKIECWISEDVLFELASFFHSARAMVADGETGKTRARSDDERRKKLRNTAG